MEMRCTEQKEKKHEDEKRKKEKYEMVKKGSQGEESKW